MSSRPSPLKKAVLFTRLPISITSRLIASIRKAGYEVPLLINCAASNYAVTPAALSSAGNLVADILSEVSDPPMVLTVTRASQAEGPYYAIDPDLMITMGFSYRITTKILRHRAPCINIHPGGLPELAGPTGPSWYILEPELHPISSYRLSIMYMNSEIDGGDLIMQPTVVLPEGETAETLTTFSLVMAAVETLFANFEEMIQRVESGVRGTPQTKLESLPHGGARVLTHEERIIRPDASMKQVSRLVRGTNFAQFPALLQFEGELYQVVGFTAELERPLDPVGAQERIGMEVLQKFEDGVGRFKVRKV
ncbi:MAG: hypothetical protein Q9162_002847 [Coniocarpon cinnabarinum]